MQSFILLNPYYLLKSIELIAIFAFELIKTIIIKYANKLTQNIWYSMRKINYFQNYILRVII